MFGNDNRTLTNTEQGMFTAANLLRSSTVDLLAHFRQPYPGSCTKRFYRPLNGLLTEGHNGMLQTDLASNPTTQHLMLIQVLITYM